MLITDFKILERILKPRGIYNLYFFKGIRGFSIDSRSIKKGEGFVAITGKHRDGHNFIQKAVNKGASFIIAEKYVATKPKVPFFIVDSAYNSLKPIAVYIRKKKKPLVYAITGSIGKSTTKEILSFLLKPCFKVLKNTKTENNFLGAVKTIFSLRDEKVMVLELGTSAKGEVESLANIAFPDIGIITFIKPVHLEGLGSLKGILDEKKSLFNVNLNMKAILNRDDPILAKARIKRKIFWFGKNKNNNLFYKLFERKDGNSVFLIQNKYKLILPYHLEPFIANFLAAISGAHILGMPLKNLISRVAYYKDFLPMRMQARWLNNFFILNDAYNANPYSFCEALKALKNYPLKKIAIVGDMLELGKKSIYYHRQLAQHIAKNDFDYCLTFGKYTLHLKDRLKRLGYEKTFHFPSQKAIAAFIKKKFRDSKKRYLIFLKASRKMELEKVIDYL